MNVSIITIIKTTSVGDASSIGDGLAGDGGRGRHTVRCQPARSRLWVVQVRVLTLHTGWLGVVTGISVASTGGDLVSLIRQIEGQ